MTDFIHKASAWLAALGIAAPAAANADPGGTDASLEDWLEGSEETFVVFPTYAAPKPDGDLVVPVRAWVYEPEESSATRAMLIGSLKSMLDIDHPERSDTFERRIRPFLVDNERGKTVEMKLESDEDHEEHKFTIGTSSADGHLQRRVRIPSEMVEGATDTDEGGRRRLKVTFEADFGMEETRRIPIIEREGVSVVSDIDDTIKVTGVTDRDEMLKNTFLRPFRAVDGMAELYGKLDENQDAAFHYVSASPWQLLPFLAELLGSADFPAGSFHLRKLRPKSLRSPTNFLSGSENYKRETIEQIMADFPERNFVLIGDSGEHDPEIYGKLANYRPDQVAAILIREVEGADNGESRFGKAFDGLDQDLWHTIEQPSQVDVEALVK